MNIKNYTINFYVEPEFLFWKPYFSYDVQLEEKLWLGIDIPAHELWTFIWLWFELDIYKAL